MRTLGIVAITASLLLSAGAHQAQAVQRLMDVRQVPTDTLRDVALAAFEQGRPVIYYNPVLMQRVGPELETYFFAHEYGHIRYGHTGAALAAGEGDLGALRVRQELEADCYAAATLAESHPESVDAAIQFFTRMGPFRFDPWHPSGAQRAAKILACLPDSARPTNASDSTVASGSSVGRGVVAAAEHEVSPN
jgi:hypothetical protein